LSANRVDFAATCAGVVRDPGDAFLRIDCMTFFDADRVVEKSRRQENTPG
jgi:hypothetical protein